MNDQTEILDAPVQAEAPASSAEITISLDKVKGEVAAFDKINAGLAKLRKQHPSDLVVDVTTPSGMKLAIAARAAYRDPRVALERARKSAKAPVLDLGRNIDKLAASIEEQLRIGESNYHDQIKVEEERKAREKKAAEEAEAARVQQIQGKIAFHFTTVPPRCTSMGSADLSARIARMTEVEVDEATFAEFSQDALAAREQALTDLIAMRDRAQAAEQREQEARTQAEENARRTAELRKQQEDFETEQRAHRERVAREHAERQAKEEAERAARKAEQDKIDADRAALARERQAEEERKAAVERARLDAQAAERRAEEDRLAAEARAAFAETQRVAEAERLARAKEAEKKAAAEAAKARKAAAKLAQAQKCGPRLLAALKGCVVVADRETAEFIEARAAIAEAEAE